MFTVQPKPQTKAVLNGQATSNPALNLSDSDKETLAFLNLLVTAILGYSILDIPEEKRQETITECVAIFTDFLVNFVEIKYGKKEATRLKAAQQFNDPKIFDKFQELGPVFEDAYSAFTQFLADRWDKKAKALQKQN